MALYLNLNDTYGVLYGVLCCVLLCVLLCVLYFCSVLCNSVLLYYSTALYFCTTLCALISSSPLSSPPLSSYLLPSPLSADRPAASVQAEDAWPRCPQWRYRADIWIIQDCATPSAKTWSKWGEGSDAGGKSAPKQAGRRVGLPALAVPAAQGRKAGRRAGKSGDGWSGQKVRSVAGRGGQGRKARLNSKVSILSSQVC